MFHVSSITDNHCQQPSNGTNWCQVNVDPICRQSIEYGQRQCLRAHVRKVVLRRDMDNVVVDANSLPDEVVVHSDMLRAGVDSIVLDEVQSRLIVDM